MGILILGLKKIILLKMQKSSLLKGYRVIDASRILVGSYSAMMLADMGAEVIKIEQPGKGDETRTWGPPFIRDNLSTYYASLNRNKKSITIDFKKNEGREIVKDLARNADVFMQNFIPRKAAEFGFDYENMKKINDNLVYASVGGFPVGSALENKAAFDLTI